MPTCFFPWKPNAGPQARPEAGARHERTLEGVAYRPMFGPYAPAQLYNGKELHSVTVLPLLPHWEQFLGRPLYNQRRTERL